MGKTRLPAGERFKDAAYVAKLAVARQRYPLHRDEAFAPIFIVGSGRSGTTLVRRVLIAGGQIHIPPEMDRLPSTAVLYRRLAGMSWTQLTNLVLANIEYSPDFELFGLKSLRALAGEIRQWDRSRRSLAAIIDALYRHHAAITIGKAPPRWGDKTPRNSRHIQLVADVFPRAQYVHVVRDGVDVAASMLVNGHATDIEDAARQWVDRVQTVREFGDHTDGLLEIRYEEFVTNPRETAQRIFLFLGLDFSIDVLSKIDHVPTMGDVLEMGHHTRATQPIDGRRVGVGRTQLAARQLEIVDRISGDLLAELHYAPATK